MRVSNRIIPPSESSMMESIVVSGVTFMRVRMPTLEAVTKTS